MSEQEYNENPELDPEQQQQDESQQAFEEAMAKKAIEWEDFKEHLAGPVISLVSHILVVTIVLMCAVNSAPQTSKDVAVEITEMEVKQFEPPPEPPPPEEEVETTEVDVEIDRPSAYVADSPSTAVGNAGVSDVMAEPAGAEVDMPNVLSVRPTTSSVVMPGIYANRGGKGRGSALGKFGGGGTHNPVLKALRWLKEHQNEDGSWGANPGDINTAMTGWALMCFLAHGETPQSVEFGYCVQRAIQWLAAYMEAKKYGTGYSHGIATYAISEAYGMTQIPMLKGCMNTGMEHIVKGLNSVGGLTYAYGTDGRSDLSVAAWNYQAMKAAYAAGCDTPGLEEAIYKAIKCLKTVSYVKGADQYSSGFAYAVTGNDKAACGSLAMVGAGTLCLQLLGEGGSPEAMSVSSRIEAQIEPKKFWISYGQDGGPSGLYGWYYMTQAVFQSTGGGGATWDKWNKQMKRGLIAAQQADGHWEKPPTEGHNNCEGLSGQVYATTLACLCLEVYYRFLPTFKGTGGLTAMKAHGAEGAKDAKDAKGAKPAAGGKKDGGDEDLGLKIL